MFGKTIFSVAVVGSLLVGCGPSASMNHNEGGACSVNDDCGGALICQPVEGRQGDYCCPTPAYSSSHANCQTPGQTGGSPVAIP